MEEMVLKAGQESKMRRDNEKKSTTSEAQSKSVLNTFKRFNKLTETPGNLLSKNKLKSFIITVEHIVPCRPLVASSSSV
jgi:hypothetical protein